MIIDVRMLLIRVPETGTLSMKEEILMIMYGVVLIR